MPVLLLTFLKNNWSTVALVVLLLIAGGIIEVKRLEIEHLQSEITGLKADNDILKTNNAALSSSLNTQNAAISSLGALSAAKQKKAATDLAAARKDSQKYAQQIFTLNAQVLTADDCQNMKNAIDIYFESVKP